MKQLEIPVAPEGVCKPWRTPWKAPVKRIERSPKHQKHQKSEIRERPRNGLFYFHIFILKPTVYCTYKCIGDFWSFEDVSRFVYPDLDFASPSIKSSTDISSPIQKARPGVPYRYIPRSLYFVPPLERKLSGACLSR